jgi:putative aldouronate transport system permease protein
MSRTAVAQPVWARDHNRAFRVIKSIVIAVATLLILLPFLNVVEISFLSTKELAEYTGSLHLIPHHLTLSAYRSIFRGGIVIRAMIVTIGITLVGTALSLLVSIGLAYALSVSGLPGRKSMLMFVLLTFLFAPGIIPLYLTVNATGMLDTYLSLIIPSLLSTFNVVVLRNFFLNLPKELLESARIDGAGYGATLRTIILPLSKPIIAVIGLFYAVSYWDAFFNALLYINTTSKWPIQLVLNTYILQGQSLPNAIAQSAQSVNVTAPTEAIQMAVLVVSMVPIIIVYPFLQKYFVKGVLTGAIKG